MNMTTITKNTAPHWSTTLAADLTQRFCAGANAVANEKVQMLFATLGEALDAGHTIVNLTDTEVDFFKQHPHPLVAVMADTSVSVDVKSGDASHHAANHKAAKHNATSQGDSDQHDANKPAKPIKPIVIVGNLAYLHRQWQQEFTLAQNLRQMLGGSPATEARSLNLSHLPKSMHSAQRAAIEAAIANRFTLITGGPGTGKTWTVAQLVLTLLERNPSIKIALAAPTGKAAQRMQEALFNSLLSSLEHSASSELLTLVKTQLEGAKTIHRLLGLGFGTAPRFHAAACLPYDLVIIDEASMLGVALAGQLLAAIGKQTKLILLGDANQLAAVDAGAVLADLTSSSPLAGHHVNLTQSTRFTADSGVGQLAAAVLIHDAERVNALLQNHAQLTQFSPMSGELYLKLWQPFSPYADALQALYGQPKKHIKERIKPLFSTFDAYRILTVTHGGRLGGERINLELTKELKSHLTLIDSGAWFHGRPVMLTQNDYSLGLANGDVGITLMDDTGSHEVYFAHLAQPIAANRLSENHIKTAFAMTIHKSQGSEFDQVAICMDTPKEGSEAANLLSCELVYTAITRAKQQVVLYASTDTMHKAINTKAVRQTGLGEMLNG